MWALSLRKTHGLCRIRIFDRLLITRRRRPSLVAYDLSAMDKTREFALEAIPPARNTGVSQTAKIANIS
jgi:hypothetical protein